MLISDQAKDVAKSVWKVEALCTPFQLLVYLRDLK